MDIVLGNYKSKYGEYDSQRLRVYPEERPLVQRLMRAANGVDNQITRDIVDLFAAADPSVPVEIASEAGLQARSRLSEAATYGWVTNPSGERVRLPRRTARAAGRTVASMEITVDNARLVDSSAPTAEQSSVAHMPDEPVEHDPTLASGDTVVYNPRHARVTGGRDSANRPKHPIGDSYVLDFDASTGALISPHIG